MIVDDDDDTRDALSNLLRRSGFDVVAAFDGEDALARLRSGVEPCLILLDIFMPRKDGWEFRAEQVADPQLSGIPTWLSNAAQLVIAVSLGARFSREFLHTAPRWLATVTVGTLGLIALCGAFAWGLSRVTGLHPATMILGTSPGGIAEMSITAKVLQLGVPIVTAFQVCRLVAVLLIVGPMYGWLDRRERRRAQ